MAVLQVNNGEQTFVDQNGDPLSGGFVYMYVTGTSTFANTWVDPGATALNTNPIVLDQAGRARIWGAGNYRQVVTDQFGNVQWDVTAGAADPQNIPGNVVVGGSLTVNGNTTINGNEIVTGNINAGSIFANGLGINGDGVVTGNFTTGNLGVTGSASITGTLTAGAINTGALSASSVTAPTASFNTINCNGASAITFTCPIDVVVGPTVLFAMDNVGNVHINGSVRADVGFIAGFNVVPISDNTIDCGNGAAGWANVFSHIYTTLSTDVASDVLADGQLALVNSLPVKTVPHIGISADDAAVIEGASVGSGTNYNVLLGVLWKAVQELSAEFESYKTAHP